MVQLGWRKFSGGREVGLTDGLVQRGSANVRESLVTSASLAWCVTVLLHVNTTKTLTQIRTYLSPYDTPALGSDRALVLTSPNAASPLRARTDKIESTTDILLSFHQYITGYPRPRPRDSFAYSPSLTSLAIAPSARFSGDISKSTWTCSSPSSWPASHFGHADNGNTLASGKTRR